MKINKAVIYYYELCGITEYKLATVSGIDRSALNRMLKRDDWEPNVYTLKRLARAVSVNVSDIMKKAEELSNEQK